MCTQPQYCLSQIVTFSSHFSFPCLSLSASSFCLLTGFFHFFPCLCCVLCTTPQKKTSAKNSLLSLSPPSNLLLSCFLSSEKPRRNNLEQERLDCSGSHGSFCCTFVSLLRAGRFNCVAQVENLFFFPCCRIAA